MKNEMLIGLICGGLIALVMVCGVIITGTALDVHDEKYLEIKNTSQCTLDNDSYCLNTSHSLKDYRNCQIGQCPACLGEIMGE